jgi:hypothetical protein
LKNSWGLSSSWPLIAFVGAAVIVPVAAFCLALAAIADSVAFEISELKQIHALHPPAQVNLAHDFPTTFFFPFELSIIVLSLLAIPCLTASVWAITTRNSYWGRGATSLCGLIFFFLLLVVLGTRYKMDEYAAEGPDAFYGSVTGTVEMSWAAVLFLAGSLACWLTNIWFRMLEQNPGWEHQPSLY